MAEVLESLLCLYHTFSMKRLILMLIGEEASLFGVWTTIKCSDHIQVHMHGMHSNPFHVHTNYGANLGRWKVIACQVHIGCQVYTSKEKVTIKESGKEDDDVAHNEDGPPPPKDTYNDILDKVGGLEAGNPNHMEVQAAEDHQQEKKKISNGCRFQSRHNGLFHW
jgi:hypothetical protein